MLYYKHEIAKQPARHLRNAAIQAMIPMMQRASASFDYFYDLADAAYGAAGTRAMSQSLNHVPLIDGNPRRGEKRIDDVGAKFVNIVPAEVVRYRIRTGVERVFGMLKDSHGGCTVRVRGHEKVAPSCFSHTSSMPHFADGIIGRLRGGP